MMSKGRELPTEIRECRNQMAKILGMPRLFVNIQLLDSLYKRYSFSNEDGSMAEAGDRVYSVIPFYPTTNPRYWLSASVDVEIGRKCDLKNVSLVVFEGEASSALKAVAFRAEWDYTDPDQAKKHAQPHWHVYSVIDKSAEDFAYTFDPEPKIMEFHPHNTNTNRQFHFAMGAQWQLAKDYHTSELNFENLCKWLDGCVNYIRGQFDYLYSS